MKFTHILRNILYICIIFQIPAGQSQEIMYFRKLTSEIKPLMLCDLQNDDCSKNGKPTKNYPIETQNHECYWLGEPCGSRYSKINDKKEEYFCSESNLQNCVIVGYSENLTILNLSPAT